MCFIVVSYCFRQQSYGSFRNLQNIWKLFSRREIIIYYVYKLFCRVPCFRYTQESSHHKTQKCPRSPNLSGGFAPVKTESGGRDPRTAPIFPDFLPDEQTHGSRGERPRKARKKAEQSQVPPMASPDTERTQRTCVCWGLFEPPPETVRADPHSLRNSGRFQEGEGERKNQGVGVPFHQPVP